jgi:hypothetical protein
MLKRTPGNKLGPLRALMLLVAVLVAQDCWACYKAPEQQLIGVDEQIMRAADVSVAQVMSATPVGGREIEYRFVVLQRLSGADQNMFTVTGSDGVGDSKDTTFDNHSDPTFWKRGGGRVMNEADCVIHPAFVVGGTYLVFLGSQWTWRSFEKIAVDDRGVNDGDKWLAYVKVGLDKRADKSRN